MKGKWLAVAALLGVVGLAWQAARGPVVAEEKKKAEVALPADLARVPRDAGVVCAVRVADLWESELAKRIRKRLGKKVLKQVAAELEKALGQTPDQVERFTFVLLAQSKDPEMMIVRTRKPYKAENVVREFAGRRATKEKYKGYALHVGDNDRSVLILDDKAFLAGQADALKSTFEKPAGKGEGLGPALRAAASGKHVVVAGVNPPVILKHHLDGEIVPPLKPFAALFQAKSGLLTIDLGEKLRAEVRVPFATEKEAKAGEKAGQAAVKLGLGLVGGLMKRLVREKDTGELVKLLRQVETGLKGGPLKLRGTELAGALEMKVAGSALDAVALQAAKRIRLAAARTQSQNNLKQLALAFHNYAANNGDGRFPPQAVYDKDGKALLSWRVLILPYIEQKALYDEFKLNEPWDSKHNKKLLKKMPRTFAHPTSKARAWETHYQAFAGNGAFFEGKRGLRITDITDGTASTIMFVEAAKAVPWTKPEDLPYDAKKPLPKLGGLFPGGFHVAMCDGSVRIVSSSISKKTLRAAITPQGGEVLGDDW
jgi:hypothetical protein